MPRTSRSSSTTWPCRAIRPRRSMASVSCRRFPEGLGLARNTKNFEVESIAVFADATWHVTDSLDLIAGARYTSDDVLNERTSFGIAPTGQLRAADPASSQASSIPAPASAATRRSTTYRRARASASNGAMRPACTRRSRRATRPAARAPATNRSDGNPAFNVEFDEETLWNYEVGIKTRAPRPARAPERIGLLHGLGGPAGRGIPVPDAR